MTANDFVSVDHLLAEITQTVGDTDFKKGFSKGWYISRIQDAMRELSFDTFWLKIQHDHEMPQNCQLKMPSNVFNIREIYLYNGTLCNPVKSQVVYWKRLFNNMYNGDGYTAQVKDDGSNSGDLFQPNVRNLYRGSMGSSSAMYYYNVHGESNTIMLSESAKAYPFIRIVYNGMGVENGELPIIPSFFERAVVDYVRLRFFEAMYSRDPRTYRVLYLDTKDASENLTTGSWNKAKKRIKSMDTKEKTSMEEYISNMIHK